MDRPTSRPLMKNKRDIRRRVLSRDGMQGVARKHASVRRALYRPLVLTPKGRILFAQSHKGVKASMP